MASFLTLSFILFYLSISCFATSFVEDISYSNFLSKLGSRVKSELQKSSLLLNSHLVFEAIEDFNRRTLVRQANDYLSEEDFDLSAAAVRYNVSEICLNHTKLVIAALLHRESWALKMLDSLGKIPSDVMEGNFGWLGSFDECIKVKALTSDNNTGTLVQESPFKGKYCAIGIPIGKIDPTNPLSALYSMIRIGMCFPDSCSNSDALALANTVLSFVPLGNSSLTAYTAGCQENYLPYDTKAIAVLVVSGFFIAILLVATVYDILAIQLPKNRQLAKEKNISNGDIAEHVEHKLNPDEYNPLLGDQTTTKASDNGHGVAGELLLAFSVYSNGKKLLSTKQPTGSLKAIHGIRFLSMTWVILGHTFAFGLQNTANLATFLPEIINRWTFQAIANAPVSVDSFFTLSGLLMSYLVLKEMKKNNGKLNWPMYYFHRFWRLTPPYMFVLMVYVPLFPYLSNGPLWPQKGAEIDFCKDTWWTNLLYINNFVYADKQCFGWSWYLANDMQFYVVSPLLFVPLFYSEIIGVIVCLVTLFGIFITTGVISTVNSMPPSSFGGGEKPDNGSYGLDYYIKPYCRMGPYIIGILTGYILYKTNCRVRMNRIANLAGWAVAAGLACAVVYGLYDPINGRHVLSVNVSSLYNTTHRTVWGACLCWVIFTCVTGNGGFVNTILSWSAFVPLSRLTYCAYLVHPIIIYVYYFSLRQPFYFTDLAIVWTFLGHLMVSYGVAFVVSLAFESPMMGLEKVIFRRGENKAIK